MDRIIYGQTAPIYVLLTHKRPLQITFFDLLSCTVLYVAECRNWARPRNFALRNGHSVACLGNRIAHLLTNLRILHGDFCENGKYQFCLFPIELFQKQCGDLCFETNGTYVVIMNIKKNDVINRKKMFPSRSN